MEKEQAVEKELSYRKNVSLITFCGGEFLLVNLVYWPPNYWKFPQGGIEPGESLEQAAHREFFEELGTDKIELIGISEKVRTYNWESPLVIDNKLYAGQEQRFVLVKFLGTKNDIKIKEDEVRAYCWTEIDNLEHLIKRKGFDFEDYWKTIREILEEKQDVLEKNGINTERLA